MTNEERNHLWAFSQFDSNGTISYHDIHQRMVNGQEDEYAILMEAVRIFERDGYSKRGNNSRGDISILTDRSNKYKQKLLDKQSKDNEQLEREEGERLRRAELTELDRQHKIHSIGKIEFDRKAVKISILISLITVGISLASLVISINKEQRIGLLEIWEVQAEKDIMQLKHYQDSLSHLSKNDSLIHPKK